MVGNLKSSLAEPDKFNETRRIKEASQSGEIVSVKRPRIDLFLESHEGVEYYFDLKTAKPNMPEFAAFKRQLMEWTAIRAAVDSKVDARTLLAIPYNPYEPEPYARWTLKGLFDASKEFLVADEFWNFLGGEGTYPELLDVFEAVGLALHPEIDARFKLFQK